MGTILRVEAVRSRAQSLEFQRDRDVQVFPKIEPKNLVYENPAMEIKFEILYSLQFFV